jgi:flagellar biosynthesis protein FliR
MNMHVPTGYWMLFAVPLQLLFLAVLWHYVSKDLQQGYGKRLAARALLIGLIAGISVGLITPQRDEAGSARDSELGSKKLTRP